MEDTLGKAFPRPRHPEAGFTLIEILVALAILTIAMTAAFTTFLSQQKSFTTQSRVSEMQQNLRYAADMLVRDIRLAGYGLPVTTGTAADNVAVPGTKNPHGITTIRSLYPVDNTAGPDQLYIMYLYDMDANQDPAVLTADMTALTSATVDNTSGFRSTGGELVMVTDRVTADLFQTTTGGSATTLSFGAGPAYNASHTKLYTVGLTPGAPPTVAAKARFVRYFIQDVAYPDGTIHPTLMVHWLVDDATAQVHPVADDIEDMQLAYGLDTNNDGAVDAFRSGEGETAISAAEIPQIRQVRLVLVARSRAPEKDWLGRRPRAGNHAAAGATDGYRRRIVEVNIDVRNSGT